jgi:hypothetical protein
VSFAGIWLPILTDYDGPSGTVTGTYSSGATVSDGLCEPGETNSDYWFGNFDCEANTWTLVHVGQSSHAVANWQPFSQAFTDSPFPPGGVSGPDVPPIACWWALFRTLTHTSADDVPPDPPLEGAAPDGCCVPCVCPDGLHTSYLLHLAAGSTYYAFTYYRWAAQVVIVTNDTTCDWLGTTFVYEYSHDGTTWTTSSGNNVHVELNTTPRCNWNMAFEAFPFVAYLYTGQTPVGIYGDGSAVS